MSGADRGGALAQVLCEETRVAAQHNHQETAEQAITKLAEFAAQSGDLLVGDNYETARGYLLLSQNDLANAADELSANRTSPWPSSNSPSCSKSPATPPAPRRPSPN